MWLASWQYNGHGRIGRCTIFHCQYGHCHPLGNPSVGVRCSYLPVKNEQLDDPVAGWSQSHPVHSLITPPTATHRPNTTYPTFYKFYVRSIPNIFPLQTLLHTSPHLNPSLSYDHCKGLFEICVTMRH